MSRRQNEVNAASVTSSTWEDRADRKTGETGQIGSEAGSQFSTMCLRPHTLPLHIPAQHLAAKWHDKENDIGGAKT